MQALAAELDLPVVIDLIVVDHRNDQEWSGDALLATPTVGNLVTGAREVVLSFLGDASHEEQWDQHAEHQGCNDQETNRQLVTAHG